MEDFVGRLADLILVREMPKLDEIMRYIAERIQAEVVAVTYQAIDDYYQDYQPLIYIRTDKLSQRKRGKDGKFIKKSSKARKRSTKRYRDISLEKAIKAFGESGQPAIGVCKELDDAFGYQAGVLFDPAYFDKGMLHSVKGFTEWDIAENFLRGQHGNKNPYYTSPSADVRLRDYIGSYQKAFKTHYRYIYNKVKNK